VIKHVEVQQPNGDVDLFLRHQINSYIEKKKPVYGIFNHGRIENYDTHSIQIIHETCQNYFT